MTSPHPCHVEGGLEGPSQDEPLPTNQNHTRPTENDLPTIHITSYGHRLGPLLPAPDLAFDLRALPNPPKNRVQRRFQETCAAIRSRAEEAAASGVGALSVGVCCELGKHRSVAFVEELGRVRFEGWNVVVRHRDVHRKNSSQKTGLRSLHTSDLHLTR
ncbi:hypothetical protein BJ912DRAFT_986370 [Pholiota molesta]|nr:hypothetical protein BJ912DRAFT_986370 [Pholiota molesta]